MIMEVRRKTNKLKEQIICISIFVLIITVIITILFHILLKQELEKSIQNFIHISRNTIEEKFSNDIIDYLDTNLLRYSRSSSYSLFFETSNSEIEYLNKIRISMIDSIRTEEFINDIILYRVEDNAVVSALRSDYTMESLASNFDDIKSIVMLGSILEPKLYVTSDKNITYLFPIFHNNKWREGSYRGFATLYIKNPASFFNVDVENFNSNGTFVLIYENNVINTEGSNTLSDEVLFDMISNTRRNKQMQKYAHHSLDYSFYYTQASSNGINYLYYEPTPSFINNLILHKSYLAFYLATIIIMFLFCVVIYLLIKRLHQSYYVQKKAMNEYSNELLKYTNPASVDLVIEKYLNFESSYTNYSIVVVEPDIAYLTNLNEKQKKYMIEEFKEIVKNLFKSLELPHIVSSQLQGYVSCIINYENTYDMKALVNSLDENFKNYSKCPFNIIYSNSYIGTTDAAKAYIRILELLKYSFIHNYNHIFSLDELEQMESKTKPIESKIIETVQGYLTDFNSENLLRYLNTTLSHIREDRFSYNQTIDFFNMILLTLKNFFNVKSFEYDLQHVPLSEQLKQFNNLDECIAFIEHNLNKYKENLLSNQTPTNKRYMENILQYIDNHIEDITLSSVAENFHITSAHLSRIFKENIGVNFSEHVSEKKLIHASNLLRENQNMNLTELANKLGYNTPSYFSSKFKERFGVTPGVYRKEYLNSKL